MDDIHVGIDGLTYVYGWSPFILILQVCMYLYRDVYGIHVCMWVWMSTYAWIIGTTLDFSKYEWCILFTFMCEK